MVLNPRQKIIKQDAFKKKTTAQRILEAEQKRKGIVPVVDQAPTIDPNAPKLGDDRKKGVFTNSAGQTVNSAGRPVDASGKPIADATAEEPIRTYEQMGESLAQESYNISDLEKELYGDTKTETSMDKYFQNLISEQDRQAQRTKESLAYQEAENIAQTADANKQIRSGTEAQLAQLTAGGREGVTGGTLGSRLKEVQGTQLARLQASAEESQAQIEDVKAKLAVAEREGRRDLVNAYQQQLDAYTVQAQESEANLVSALSDQAKTQSAITQTNIQTFQGLIDEGQELSVETISGFAKKLGIDFDTAYGYYAGVQNVRDSKNLLEDEKIVEIDKLKSELDMQIRGVTTESAKKIDYLDKQTQQWASMGYSPTEIQEMRSNMRTMLGIEDQSDPAYLADLAYKQAQTTYSQSNTAVNYQDLLTKQLEYAQSMGYTGEAYVPNSTRNNLYNVTTATSEDGSTSVQVTDKNGKPLQAGDYGGQCGKFVNDLFGEGVFTDLYTEKLAKVDFGVTVPAPGMAIVIPMAGSYAKNGHVVYVTGVDAMNQQVNYIESNGSGDERIGYDSMTFQELGQLISERSGGLVVNPNSRVEGGQGGAQPFTYQSYYDDAVSQGMSAENAEKYASNMLSSASSFKNETSQKNYVIYSVLNDENKTYVDAVSNLSDAELQDYADKNGYFSRQLVNLDQDSTMSNAVIDKLIDDQATRNLIRNQQRWIGAKLRGESGAAITVGEYLTEAQKYFPTGSDTADTIKDLQAKRDFYTQSLKNGLDEYGKKLIWEAEQSQNVQEEENPWGEIDTESPDDILNLW